MHTTVSQHTRSGRLTGWSTLSRVSPAVDDEFIACLKDPIWAGRYLAKVEGGGAGDKVTVSFLDWSCLILYPVTYIQYIQ